MKVQVYGVSGQDASASRLLGNNCCFRMVIGHVRCFPEGMKRNFEHPFYHVTELSLPEGLGFRNILIGVDWTDAIPLALR